MCLECFDRFSLSTALAVLSVSAVLLFFRRTRTFAVILLLIGTVGSVLSLLEPVPDWPRSGCANHVRKIGLALRAYEQRYHCFPPAYVADANGHPMHSWRVLLLPYLDHIAVYRSYRFDEPWDGPHNRALAAAMPREYRCPDGPAGSLMTNYVAIVGPRTMWPGDKPASPPDVTVGDPQTLLIVETHTANIHWMEPRDLQIDNLPLKINPPLGVGISSPHTRPSRSPVWKPNGAFAITAGGAVRWLSDELPAETLSALLTRNGGEQGAACGRLTR